jgi:hypothetical protein
VSNICCFIEFFVEYFEDSDEALGLLNMMALSSTILSTIFILACFKLKSQQSMHYFIYIALVLTFLAEMAEFWEEEEFEDGDINEFKLM